MAGFSNVSPKWFHPWFQYDRWLSRKDWHQPTTILHMFGAHSAARGSTNFARTAVGQLPGALGPWRYSRGLWQGARHHVFLDETFNTQLSQPGWAQPRSPYPREKTGISRHGQYLSYNVCRLITTLINLLNLCISKPLAICKDVSK